VNLHDLDLNLLVVFDDLMAQRRVSRVAERMGVSQPAVSNALAKLRRHFNDELFVRTPRGMQPTTFAEDLARPIGAALAQIRAGLERRAEFAPRTATRAVTIAMTDIGEIVFLPPLLERLRREAPGVTLSTVRDTAVVLEDEMQAGKVDLAIGLLPRLKAGFYQRRLFTQRYVCLMRRGHRLDKRRISVAEFAAAEHVVVVASGTGHGEVDTRLRRAGIERRVAVTVPHFVGVGHLLHDSDLVATVPERLADRLIGPFGLAKVAHPAKLPEATITLFWHAKQHRSAVNQWLRGVVVERFGDGAS
jgi:DNA-binding transcriptional LysR family regulator